jgi:hypothetical protein
LDLLNKLKEVMDKPVKLSETEKEKFNKVFELLHDWLKDSESEILELDREEAYRRIAVLNTYMSNAQKQWLDPGAPVEVQVQSRIRVNDTSGLINQKNVPLIQTAPDGTPIEIIEETDRERFPVVKKETVTSEQFQGMLDALPDKARRIANTLDCVKDFEEIPEIICNGCNPERMMECIRMEDPSYTDAATEFIKHQLGD